MAKKVTLDDIAAATNLSKFSVSRAIAGKSGISEETRKVVLEACERLGYVKKGSPSGNEKKYVLFVIPKIDAKDTTFWMKVILGVESDLTLRGYSLHLKENWMGLLELFLQDIRVWNILICFRSIIAPIWC